MGRREFAFATRALRDGRMMRAFTHFIAASSFTLAGLGAVAQFIPAGPDTPLKRAVLAVVMVSAVAVGIRWLWVPWPRYRSAVAFVVWADTALMLAALVMSTPEARLSSTLYMGLTGVFAAFLLSARILLAHCTFGGALIVGITAVGMLDGANLPDLFVFFMPALTWVVFVPLGGFVLIESGRRAIRATVRSAERDPLTGLRNRRGMLAAFGAALRRAPGSVTVAVAVCDIDRFKQLNDTRGHTEGDRALIALAEGLRAVALPDEITARIGGDELVLVGLYRGDGEVADLSRRLEPLTRLDDSGLRVSIGLASMPTDTPHFLVDDVVRHADTAMYEAKRAGGGRCSVYRHTPTEADPVT
ncbi:MAG: GGDEF domain-containing protein [Mycolicibacterium rufum]|nr:GGDEF domain-containing protein [Mycolicibacterium rufum]